MKRITTSAARTLAATRDGDFIVMQERDKCAGKWYEARLMATPAELRKILAMYDNSKFTEDQIIAIRCLYRQGINRHCIAKVFGVDHSTIGEIIANKTWRHVGGAS